MDSREILGEFHSTYNTRMDSRLNDLDMNLLQSQIQIRQQAFKDLTEVFKAKVETFQKDANRQFTPVIMRTLAQAYSDVRQETGKYILLFICRLGPHCPGLAHSSM